MDIKSISVITCEQATTPEGYYVPPHFHPYYEFIYYISGEGTGKIEDDEYSYKAGVFIIIPPFTKHIEKTIKTSKNIVVPFKCNKLDTSIINKLFNDTKDNDILKRILSIKEEHELEEEFFIEKISFELGSLLIDLIRKANGKKEKEKYDITVIKNYLDEHFLDEIDFEYLASKVFYSYDYLRHYFKKETGLSLKQYIINRTIEYSKALIFEGYSIKEVSEKCKFSTPSHFIFTFKKCTNQTPLEFKSYLKK